MSDRIRVAAGSRINGEYKGGAAQHLKDAAKTARKGK